MPQQIVRITAKRAGFRRAGIAHPDRPVEYPIDRFAPEALERLRGEPMLIVDVIDQPDQEIAPAGSGKGK